MKKIIFTIITFFYLIFSIYPAEKTAKIEIYAPKTLSSIPLIELDGVQIGNQTIKVNFFDDHILGMAEFISGKFPVLMTGFSQGLSHYLSSKNIIMVTTPVWGVSSLVTNDPSLKELSDFKGKTILVPFARSPLELQLKAIIKKENLTEMIRVDYAVIQQQIPLLLAKKTNGICIPEPLVSKLVIEKKGYEVFSFAKKWGELNNGDGRSPQVSLFVKNNFAKNNKNILDGLIRLLKEKNEWVKRNPEEAADKYASVFNIDKEIILRGLKNVLFDMNDSKTEKQICVNYQKAIDEPDIDDNFFYYHK